MLWRERSSAWEYWKALRSPGIPGKCLGLSWSARGCCGAKGAALGSVIKSFGAPGECLGAPGSVLERLRVLWREKRARKSWRTPQSDGEPLGRSECVGALGSVGEHPREPEAPAYRVKAQRVMIQVPSSDRE